MDKKSKIFFIIFSSLLFLSVFATFLRIFIFKNYIIEAEADCDPEAEACFVWTCDPEAGEECSGDPEEDTSYYKIMRRLAKNIPLCDPAEETCTALVCDDYEMDCEYIYCDAETSALYEAKCSGQRQR